MSAWSPAGLYFRQRFKRDGSKPADLVVFNAKVVTCDPRNSRARAVAVKDERIAYVGGDSGASDYVGPDTSVVDGRGRVLTPGFVDNHCHVLWIGGLMSMMTQELYECANLGELKEALERQSVANPDLPFVMGVGWRYDYIPEGKPDRVLLDSLIQERPVILMSYGGQCGWLNSSATRLLYERNPVAFDRLVPEVDSKSGEHIGILNHFHPFSPFDFFSAEELGAAAETGFPEAMTRVLDEALSVGVTTMNDVQLYRSFMPTLLKFRDNDGLSKVRVRGSYHVGHHDLQDEGKLKADLAWWKETGEKESDSHLLLGESLKFYIDGVSSNHTAFMLEPYGDKPSNYGDPVWTQEEFDRVIEIIDGMGLQACTHSCGDAGIRRVINSYERAREVNGERDSRHRSEHCPLPTREDRERMARLGVYAAMQPAQFAGGDENTEKVMGNERLQRLQPWRSLAEAGVEISFGSDWCAGPINPIYGLFISATRRNHEGKADWGPDEKIDLESAIGYWTIGSARALMMEDDIGSIEVGKYGDLVLFNTNPLKLDSLWFMLTHKLELGALDDFVDMTVVGGEVVYRKEGARLT